jgi:hypothetical protein
MGPRPVSIVRIIPPVSLQRCRERPGRATNMRVRRGGRPLHNRLAMSVAGSVEAARIQGGQPPVPFLPAGGAKFVLDLESGTVY